MKKKIAIICTTSLSINAFWLDHLEKLSKFYDIDIITKDTNQIKLIKNVNMIELNFSRRIDFINDCLCLFRLLKYFIKNKYDITLSFSPKAGLLTAITSFLLRTKIRIHYFTGQLWINKFFTYQIIFKNIDRTISFLSTNILVDSHSQRYFLIKNKITTELKSKVLGNGSISGVDMTKFQFKKNDQLLIRQRNQIKLNDFVILYLGRINKDKGVLLLLEAIKLLSKELQNLTLMLVGEIEDLSLNQIGFYKKYINLKIVKFTNTPEKYLNSCDLLCLPSYREGFGKVVIEAASCGKFSLVSNIYGLKDSFIKNLTGISFDINDQKSLINNIKYCYINRKKIEKLNTKCREFVKENYEKNYVTQNLVNYINTLI